MATFPQPSLQSGYKPRVTRGFTKPHAVGTSLYLLSWERRLVVAREQCGSAIPAKSRQILRHRRPAMRWTEISIQFLRSAVDYVSVMGMVRRVAFRTTTNPQARARTTCGASVP
ncbi:hypothetical protein AVEN_21292-1 [Araneus ventricosus]|uniref:Uncharacterized protein n=1 Tax=Araneus ventricosus TaxID=182803 RepID=A0A4Y2LTP7_ARAVE|nr:hypothetical protein AVEN_21292-1 [Araneus ventricosus]